MNEVNKTLYIPLFGKSYVSKKGIILEDKKAEKIWESEGFALRGKSKSKWLAYYMGMRARVFDDWTRDRLLEHPTATVLHIGCGLDSRVERVGGAHRWYDIDFVDVIRERRKYYTDSERYIMLPGDARETNTLDSVVGDVAIVIMEGVSMYLTYDELSSLFSNIWGRFGRVYLLMDCYTTFAAKMSKIKNPINDVGVTQVYGMDEPRSLTITGMEYLRELDMTPISLINELTGAERAIFKTLYGGGASKKLYRLYEYQK
ncbi:MAG: class I SAM-dependent methyltransferase [Clostridia bacterium]|nr:class I SAM-dependent methyltransferase [Clostridia bacterium]